MAKTLTLRIDERTYRAFREAAEADRRSLANWVETAALRHLEESRFTDEEETREILSDKSLMRRLRAGLRDVARGRVRRVD